MTQTNNKLTQYVKGALTGSFYDFPSLGEFYIGADGEEFFNTVGHEVMFDEDDPNDAIHVILDVSKDSNRVLSLARLITDCEHWSISLGEFTDDIVAQEITKMGVTELFLSSHDLRSYTEELINS